MFMTIYEDSKSPPDLLTLTISAELMGRKCGHFGVCLSNYKETLSMFYD